MPIIEVNGRKVEVDDSFLSMTPEQQNAAVDEIATSLGAKPVQEAEQAAVADENIAGQREELAAVNSKFFSGQKDENAALRKVDSFVRGAADTASLGLADEAAAFMNASNPARTNDQGMVMPSHPLATIVDYFKDGDDSALNSELRRERAFQAQREDIDSGAMLGGRITGGLLGAGALIKANAPFMAALPANASLTAKTVQGAKAGALYSGLYGLGSGEGVGDRLEEGAEQALTGAAIGGAIPGVTEAVKAVAKPVTDAVKGYFRPEIFANQKIAERVANSGQTIDQAARKMERMPGTTLADVGGKTTQNLLRTAMNVPGKAQDAALTMLNRRQLSQGDRLKTIIRQTFADPDAFDASRARLFELQAETSRPLYERALSRQNVWNNRLDQFLRDPITQRGINQGVRIQRLEALAENRPFNPSDYAITAFNEAGDPIIGAVPNMRTINVVKKGFDAMLEGARHPITGRLTEEGRAIDQVRRAFLAEVDRVNPDYAAARRHYADFMQVNEAMQVGRDAMTMSPPAFRARVAEMNDVERAAARVGAADALRKGVDEAGWTHNAVLKLFNSRQRVNNIRELFDNAEDFADARRMVFAEVRKRTTYDKAKGNSTTAAQMADMMEAGGLKEGVDFAQNAATGGITSATLRWVGSRLKALGGFTPDVAEQVARKLTTSDPARVRQITNDLMRIEQQKISADQKRQLVQRITTPLLAEGVRESNRQ